MKTIIFNGRIYVECHQFVSAILMEDGFVQAIGSDEEILAMQDSDTRLIDAKQKSVLPGFNDSHLHLHGLGLTLQSIRLSGATSIEEVIQISKEFIQTHQIPVGKFVYGRGWNQDYFNDESRMLTKEDLDLISTEHPILLNRACGHLAVCNSKALEVCGIDKNTAQIEGAEFYYGDDGEPNGIFTENAIDLIRDHIPPQTVEEMAQTINIAMDYALRHGITSIQTNDIHAQNYNEMHRAYEMVYEMSCLRPRTYHQSTFFDTELYREFLDKGFVSGSGTMFNKMGPLKIFVDGSLGARTALLNEPYRDDKTTSGIACLSQEQLNQLVEMANQNDCQVIVHGIGDKAIEMILDAYQLKGNARLRNGVVHAQITSPAMIERFVAENVVALVQPIFIHYDMHIVAERVGKLLAQTSYAFGDMYRKGVKLNYGTDSPVEDLKPFDNLYCAVARKDLCAQPADGYGIEQAVSLHDAIMLYTHASAYNSFEEDIKGRIVVGNVADCIILDQDIFNQDIELLRHTNVLMTIVNGEICFQKSDDSIVWAS